MSSTIGERKAQIRVGSLVSLVIEVAAAIVAFFEAGVLGAVITIPLWLFAMLGSIVGVVPFAGPFIYYFAIGALFGAIIGAAGIAIPVAAGLLFWSSLIFSCIYCLMTTLVLLVVRRRK